MATRKEPHLLYRGEHLAPERLAQLPGLGKTGHGVVAVGLHDDPDEAVVFDDVQSFLRWLPAGPAREPMHHSFAKAAELRSSRAVTEEQFVHDWRVRNESIKPALSKLAADLGIPKDSPQLFKEAHERGILHTIFVYDQPYGKGAWTFYDGPVPVFGWTGWDNRIQSYLPFGFGGMWSDNWFWGPAVAVGGIGAVVTFEGTLLGWFSRRASSGYISGP